MPVSKIYPVLFYGGFASLLYIASTTDLLTTCYPSAPTIIPTSPNYYLILIFSFWILLLAFIYSKTKYTFLESSFLSLALIISLTARLARKTSQQPQLAFMLDIIAISFFAGLLFLVITNSSKGCAQVQLWSSIFGILTFLFFIFLFYLEVNPPESLTGTPTGTAEML